MRARRTLSLDLSSQIGSIVHELRKLHGQHGLLFPSPGKASGQKGKGRRHGDFHEPRDSSAGRKSRTLLFRSLMLPG